MDWRLLDIKKAVRTDDGAGGYATEWQFAGQIWAYLVRDNGQRTRDDLAAREYFSGRWVVRDLPSEAAIGDQLVDGTVIYEITAISRSHQWEAILDTRTEGANDPSVLA